jgi:hypothetical protein
VIDTHIRLTEIILFNQRGDFKGLRGWTILSPTPTLMICDVNAYSRIYDLFYCDLLTPCEFAQIGAEIIRNHDRPRHDLLASPR